ncbi:caspase family protein [Bradyrhizobium sp.]|uniref:caspase family protein n=1 Tax=Bradyrhizobium sp. TaxID=376 RepID=UPI003C316478
MFRHIFRTAFFRTAFIAGAMFAGMPAAFAENRLALVIGESAYRAVTPLPNPANDAKAMAKLLSDAGFEVTSAADLSQKDMNQKIGDFAARIASKGSDTVALVFYAGHGVQIDGENYLVPVDVDPKREADIPLQAVRLDDILNTLNSVPSRMRILLLDACRNNPFPAINQSAGHGLALVDAKTGAPGTFMSYSTSPGAEAEDGNGADSPYTTALLEAAREPGVPIEEAFKRVRVAVNKATDGRQTPWESSSLTEDFKFMAGNGPASANAGPMPIAAKQTVDDWRRQLQGKPVDVAHDMVVADDSVEAYQAFVALYVQSPFAAEAHVWLDRQHRMLAWNEAVLINTAASYRAFLAAYPDSDLTATANRLVERLRYRPSVQPVVAALTSAPSQPAIASLGPCATPPATPPVLLKKADVTPVPHDPEPAVHAVVLPPRDPVPPVHTGVLPPGRTVALPPRQPPPARTVMVPPRPVSAYNGGVVYRRPPFRGGYYGPVGFRMGLGGGYGRGPIGFPGRFRGGY